MRLVAPNEFWVATRVAPTVAILVTPVVKKADFDFAQQRVGGASTAQTVTDIEGLEIVAAGADCFCPYCESVNRGSGNICVQCGADRTTCCDENPVSRDESPGQPSRKSIFLGLTSGFFFFDCAGCCCLGYRATQPEPVTGQVNKLAWSHTVEVEEFQPVEKEGGRDEQVEGPSKSAVDGKGEIVGVKIFEIVFKKFILFVPLSMGKKRFVKMSHLNTNVVPKRIAR